MSQAKAICLRTGLRNNNAIYAQIKNGNIYRLNRDVPEAHHKAFGNKVASNNNKIQLKNWTLVRKAGGKS
jgi:hypothetical protein